MQLRHQESPVLLLGVWIERVAGDEPFTHHLKQVAAGCSEVIRGSVRIDKGFRRLSRHAGKVLGRIHKRETGHGGPSVFSTVQRCPRPLDQELIGASYVALLASAVSQKPELLSNPRFPISEPPTNLFRD